MSPRGRRVTHPSSRHPSQARHGARRGVGTAGGTETSAGTASRGGQSGAELSRAERSEPRVTAGPLLPPALAPGSAMPLLSVPKEVAVGTAMLGVAFVTGMLAGKRRPPGRAGYTEIQRLCFPRVPGGEGTAAPGQVPPRADRSAPLPHRAPRAHPIGLPCEQGFIYFAEL